MWLSWLPWKYLIRTVARRKGFIDPIALLARLDAISQPANTRAPVELLRAGAVLHARGFINNHVIQHNLDWIWPFWVERQFDPTHPAFIPRAFSMTHINITQRNWTAVGYPDCEETPIVDGRGLLMPFFDSWSLDGWFVPDSGNPIFPSRLDSVTQTLETGPNLRVITRSTGRKPPHHDGGDAPGAWPPHLPLHRERGGQPPRHARGLRAPLQPRGRELRP
jgi:hypothetical protein